MPSADIKPKTLYDKVFQAHIVDERLYIGKAPHHENDFEIYVRLITCNRQTPRPRSYFSGQQHVIRKSKFAELIRSQQAFEGLRRPLAPKLDLPEWKKVVKYWSSLKSDAEAAYNEELFIDARDIAPTVSWGTSPQDVVPITGVVPDPESFHGEAKKESGRQALMYMGLRPGTRMEEIELDKVFIGSCINTRIEDLRVAAWIVEGRRVAPNLKRAIIIPGSGLVKKQAEAEGLDRIFQEAGFEWREAGCSMCLGMNPDILSPGERCASTSNRNFEGRQGAGGRTHLMSPVMVAAAAIVGKLADVRKLADQDTTPSKASPRVDVTPEVSEVDTDDDLDRILDLPSEPQTQNRDGGASASGGQTKFTVLKSIAATMERSNIDTDAIIPKQFLKTIKRTGLGSALFHSLQYKEDGGEKAETAFPVAVPNQPTLERIAGEARAGHEIKVNLIHQRINDASGGKLADFEVEEFRKHCLVNGLDNIGLTMQINNQIKTFEDRRTLDTPWLDGSGYLKRRDRKGPIHVEAAPVPKTNRGEDIEEPLEW
ncbi:MAG: hypothetical protein Q9177_000058 [Variospora cf. flavescens]